MSRKIAALAALGGAALLLAACGDSGYAENDVTPPEPASADAIPAEETAADAAATVPVEEVPETPAEPLPYEPGEAPPPPEPPKSENIFY